jgi:hypothetical protein
MPQILFCKASTTEYEVKTFLIRVILSKGTPHFMIGTHHLNSRIQNIFC